MLEVEKYPNRKRKTAGDEPQRAEGPENTLKQARIQDADADQNRGFCRPEKTHVSRFLAREIAGIKPPSQYLVPLLVKTNFTLTTQTTSTMSALALLLQVAAEQDPTLKSMQADEVLDDDLGPIPPSSTQSVLNPR